MSEVTASVSRRNSKRLQYIIQYYNTTVGRLLSSYIDWLARGNIPHGYEELFSTGIVETVVGESDDI